MRVRFAPAPSGFLHLGNVRTALFNWLLARQHGGTLVLRIEDTDQDRAAPEYEAAIREDLAWLGLTWDEGPDIGGPYGPYRQSERRDMYQEALEILKARAAVYPCYCSEAALDAERRAQLARGVPPRYSGTCRNLSSDECRRLEAEGRTPAWRFRTPGKGAMTHRDLVRGEMQWDLGQLSDFIIVRDNGWPTYQFAVVVDDARMEITHVLRGEDGLANTPRQILIYQALGHAVPQFGHLPLILGEDRQPLSKRHGDFSVRRLRELGYLPEAILNHIALLGWSPPEGKEVFSLDELVQQFSLDRVSKSGAVFQEEKLRWFNRHALGKLQNRYYQGDWSEAARFIAPSWLEESDLTPDQIYDSVGIGLKNIEILSQLEDVIHPFFFMPDWQTEALPVELDVASARKVVDAALLMMARPPETFKDFINAVQEAGGCKGKILYHPIRLAWTGKLSGVELEHYYRILGPKECDIRLRAFKDKLDRNVQ